MLTITPHAAYALTNPFDKQDDKEVLYSPASGADGGFTASQIDNADPKPRILIEQKELEKSEAAGKTITVKVSVKDSKSKYGKVELVFCYDTRLTLKQRDGKWLTPGAAVSGLSPHTNTPSSDGYIVFSAMGISKSGQDGVLFEADFIVPDNADGGRLYPFGIQYVKDSSITSYFTNVDQNETGQLMQAWTFTRGITNGYIRIKGGSAVAPEFDNSTAVYAGGVAGETCEVTYKLSSYTSDTTVEAEYSTGGWNSLCTPQTVPDTGTGKLSFTLPSVGSDQMYSFRLKAVNAEGTGYSKAVNMFVYKRPVFTVHPKPISVEAGEKGILSCSVECGYYTRLKWQVQTSSAGPWEDYTEYENLSSSCTKTYIIDPVTPEMNGYCFRAVMMHSYMSSTINSSSAKLTVTGLPPISSVDVEISKPVAGKKPSYTPDLGVNEGVEFSLGTVTNDTMINSVTWFDETDEGYLETTDSFKAGHVYQVRMDLYPENGFEFNNDISCISAKVNGSDAVKELRESGDVTYLRLRYTFPAVAAPPAEPTTPSTQPTTPSTPSTEAPSAGGTPSTETPSAVSPSTEVPSKEKVPSKGTVLIDSAGTVIYTVNVSNAADPCVTYTEPRKQKATVTIPATVKINGVTYKITAISANAFKNNKKITKVRIGKNVTTIGTNAFNGCRNLKTVTIGSKVATIGNGAFAKCSALTKITLPASVKKVGKNAFLNCVKLKTVTGGKGLTTIGVGAFSGCKVLAKITLYGKVKTIGKNAFLNCKKLKTVVIKSTKLTTKTVGANAFKGIYAKAGFKVPKAKLKAYKTLLKKKGIGKKAKITK